MLEATMPLWRRSGAGRVLQRPRGGDALCCCSVLTATGQEAPASVQWATGKRHLVIRYCRSVSKIRVEGTRRAHSAGAMFATTSRTLVLVAMAAASATAYTRHKKPVSGLPGVKYWADTIKEKVRLTMINPRCPGSPNAAAPAGARVLTHVSRLLRPPHRAMRAPSRKGARLTTRPPTGSTTRPTSQSKGKSVRPSALVLFPVCVFAARSPRSSPLTHDS